MEKEKKKCSQHSSFKDTLGNQQYYPCPHKPKYKITFLGVRGEKIEQYVCGVHFKATQKNALRLKKKHNINSEFSYEELI